MDNAWDALHLHGAESGDLRLRLATETDLPEILRMLLDPTALTAIAETAEHAEQTLRRLWSEEPHTSGLRHFLAERISGREVIAYLRLEYPFNEPGCLWLTFFCVAPGRRSQGYGRRIMALLIAEASGSGCVRKFGVHTIATNAAAVGLYQSSGFECTKREPWRTTNGDTSDRLTFCQAFREAGGARDSNREAESPGAHCV